MSITFWVALHTQNNALADSLKWVLCSTGVKHSLHDLDDFLFGENPSVLNVRPLSISMTLATFSKVGVPIALEKMKGPLGIILDSVKGEIHLPKLMRNL